MAVHQTARFFINPMQSHKLAICRLEDILNVKNITIIFLVSLRVMLASSSLSLHIASSTVLASWPCCDDALPLLRWWHSICSTGVCLNLNYFCWWNCILPWQHCCAWQSCSHPQSCCSQLSHCPPKVQRPWWSCSPWRSLPSLAMTPPLAQAPFVAQLPSLAMLPIFSKVDCCGEGKHLSPVKLPFMVTLPTLAQLLSFDQVAVYS